MEAELGKDKLVPARLQKVVPPDAFEAIQAADLIGWDGAVGLALDIVGKAPVVVASASFGLSRMAWS
jgi:hypothetical protein